MPGHQCWSENPTGFAFFSVPSSLVFGSPENYSSFGCMRVGGGAAALPYFPVSAEVCRRIFSILPHSALYHPVAKSAHIIYAHLIFFLFISSPNHFPQAEKRLQKYQPLRLCRRFWVHASTPRSIQILVSQIKGVDMQRIRRKKQHRGLLACAGAGVTKTQKNEAFSVLKSQKLYVPALSKTSTFRVIRLRALCPLDA